MNTSMSWLVVIATMSLFIPLTAAAESRTIGLETLDLKLVRLRNGPVRINLSHADTQLTIAGRTFDRGGIGTQTRSHLWIDLAGGSDRFQASVGIDDKVVDAHAQAVFSIYLDGRKTWNSGVIKRGTLVDVDLDLRGAKTMILASDDPRTHAGRDPADWIDARFTVTGAVPRTIKPIHEPQVILTPTPPSTPRINGARIFGVRPGSPFLYRIAATGDRPMTFAVDDLPAGLSVDAQSGVITGRLASAGEHVVRFKATNSLGTATRQFRIVCGDTLALTPHMGWNSWYVWTDSVTDEIMRGAADAMVASGMANHGYEYVNIDDCWAVAPEHKKDPLRTGTGRDAYGRILGNGHFPDMKALTDYIHSKGLKAGIYSSPGPLTCAKYEGSYQHEELDARQFADWGFDFLKYDWCTYGQVAGTLDRPVRQKPYVLMGELLRKQSRDIVFNLCQYGHDKVWEWGDQVYGHSWRTGDDLGGNLDTVGELFLSDGFDLYADNELHKYAKPGCWNDPDYLLLGFLGRGKSLTSMSPNQQYTQVSLWAMLAAPLIFSGDMAQLDDFTLNLLCNNEVIDVDQDPLGKAGHRASKNGEAEVWVRDLEDGSKAVALFNRGEGELTVIAKWDDLGVQGRQKARDLWRQQDIGTFENQIQATLQRHGVMLMRLWPQQ